MVLQDAGMKLAGVSSTEHPSLSSLSKELLQSEDLLHSRGIAGSVFAHCPIFPTAASRRSPGRVSVPVWLIILSDQLTIVALVGLLPRQQATPYAGSSPGDLRLFGPRASCGISDSFPSLIPHPETDSPRVTHLSATAGLPQPCDLHVLSMPPAFALSQDQTLRFICARANEKSRRSDLLHQTRTTTNKP